MGQKRALFESQNHLIGKDRHQRDGQSAFEWTLIVQSIKLYGVPTDAGEENQIAHQSDDAKFAEYFNYHDVTVLADDARVVRCAAPQAKHPVRRRALHPKVN